MGDESNPVIAAALEYESATLDALRALDGTDGDAQIAACLRFADALAVITALPAEDHNHSLTFLTRRGLIPSFAWKQIHAAMEILAADLRSPAH
jgi:hypothetical protein